MHHVNARRGLPEPFGRSGIPGRWRARCLRRAAALSGVHLAVTLLALGTAVAQPAPDTTQAALTRFAVRLSWNAGSGPYGVFRSTSPQNLVAPANFHAVTDDVAYEDSLEAATGSILYYRIDASITCKKDADCDNGNPCDGIEDCSKPPPNPKICLPGAPTFCDDGDPCSFDTCSPLSGTCSATAPDCDDGNPCTLDTCIAGVGCEYAVEEGKVGTPAELAGNSLGQYPFFDYVRAFNEDATVELAVDPGRHAAALGKTCDVYVVEAKSALGWCSSGSLTDVRGAPDVVSFGTSSIQSNTITLASPFELGSTVGEGFGRGYDVALDCDRDGRLSLDELVDGLGDRAGLYVIHDLTLPGSHATSQFDDIGPASDHCDFFPVGGNDDMRVYYPADLDSASFVGKLPLVVISHGNGHCFDWYDFLGTHLASYGYIVMSHDNDTGPGIETASQTTLDFTDKILTQQAALGGGVLDGHIDGGRIAWIGHSRGGEGVVRAYDRIVDEGFTPQAYTAEDIVVISSIAPTDFLGPTQADPHDNNYHLLYGSADGDVCGCPNNSIAQSFGIYERATGSRHSTYVQGADHNDFNCCGFNDFSGPAATQIGRAEAQQVQKAIQLATIERYVKGNDAAEDLFWRQYETFKPIGVAPTTVVVNEYREGPAERGLVIDDYQTQAGTGTSSSGGLVSFSVANLAEDLLREVDGQLTWTGTEPMNGMTRARANDLTRGAVFDFGAGGDAFYELEIVAGERDLTDDTYLSFRAAQGTRHPETTAALADLSFTVTLVDGFGTTSSIRIDAYGAGLEEPYQRTGFGTGAGWQNEFETIRIRLGDFLANGSGLDLGNVEFVRLEFGSSFGSAEGRVAIDDVELVRE